MIVSEEQYLAHYGVLGMKWGKRKAAREEWKKKKNVMRKERTELTKKAENEVYESKLGKRVVKELKTNGRSDKYIKLSTQAVKLYDKKVSDVNTQLTKKYGKDYERLIKGEQRLSTSILIGGEVASVLAVVGTVKLTKFVGNKAVSGIAKVFENIDKRMR